MFKWLSNLFNPKPKEEPVPYKVEPVKVEEVSNVQAKPENVVEPELLKAPVMPAVETPVEPKPKRDKVTKGKTKADDKVIVKESAKKVKKEKVEKAVPAMKVSKPRTKKAN